MSVSLRITSSTARLGETGSISAHGGLEEPLHGLVASAPACAAGLVMIGVVGAPETRLKKDYEPKRMKNQEN